MSNGSAWSNDALMRAVRITTKRLLALSYRVKYDDSVSAANEGVALSIQAITKTPDKRQFNRLLRFAYWRGIEALRDDHVLDRGKTRPRKYTKPTFHPMGLGDPYPAPTPVSSLCVRDSYEWVLSLLSIRDRALLLAYYSGKIEKKPLHLKMHKIRRALCKTMSEHGVHGVADLL